jgi:hypothetical protein
MECSACAGGEMMAMAMEKKMPLYRRIIGIVLLMAIVLVIGDVFIGRTTMVTDLSPRASMIAGFIGFVVGAALVSWTLFNPVARDAVRKARGNFGFAMGIIGIPIMTLFVSQYVARRAMTFYALSAPQSGEIAVDASVAQVRMHGLRGDRATIVPMMSGAREINIWVTEDAAVRMRPDADCIAMPLIRGREGIWVARVPNFFDPELSYAAFRPCSQ